MVDYEKQIAEAGLKIKALELRPANPFTWASGYRMPIYNDNRLFLGSYENRMLVADGFMDLLEKNGIHWRIIAGTSTAGIPPANTLADLTESPLIYIRDKPKSHGLKNQIEGIGAEKDLEGKKVIIIEDLISTGGSSARAVQAVRDANGECIYCLSIFNYGLDKAVQAFDSLEPKCEVRSILTYDVLLEVAKEKGYLTKEQVKLLEDWRADPFNWGEKNGFPKVERQIK